jgi:hypothetical protein
MGSSSSFFYSAFLTGAFSIFLASTGFLTSFLSTGFGAYWVSFMASLVFSLASFWNMSRSRLSKSNVVTSSKSSWFCCASFYLNWGLIRSKKHLSRKLNRKSSRKNPCLTMSQFLSIPKNQRLVSISNSWMMRSRNLSQRLRPSRSLLPNPSEKRLNPIRLSRKKTSNSMNVLKAKSTTMSASTPK